MILSPRSYVFPPSQPPAGSVNNTSPSPRRVVEDNEEAMVHPSQVRVAGYDLSLADYWATHLATVKHGLVEHLIKGKGVTNDTMKTADGIQLQALAKQDHASGKWTHYNAKTGEAYGLPISFNPQAAGLQHPISHSQLLNKLDIAQARKPDMAKAACYEAALRIGIVEGTVIPKALDTVLHVTNDAQSVGTRYTQTYEHLMGITSSNVTKTFKPELITESGVLNFKRVGDTEPFAHTVYVQRSKTGELFLFNKNEPSLDMAMADRNHSPVTAGACQVYALDSAGHTNLQKWLGGPPARQVVYTPASVINANALRLAP